ncbi:MAG: ribbon-helix-helix domain-containing protein, partial [Gammaproteobacteria bacterium]|nr:ribbon-helix-helix domain-containing protein [Gammaproteobacteria bacterium]
WGIDIEPRCRRMRRTIISLSDEDKVWLDQHARAERVPMTELVRRAVREYRERYDAGGSSRLKELLRQTRGCWTHGDGLRYQDAVRDEWERRG